MSDTSRIEPPGRNGDSLSTRLLRKAPRIRTINAFAIVIAAVLAFSVVGINMRAYQVNEWVANANEEYTDSIQAVYDLNMTSDYLSANARTFVMTGNPERVKEYFMGLSDPTRQANAVETLRAALHDEDSNKALDEELAASAKLNEINMRAMRLAAEGYGIDDVPEALADVELSEHDEGLSSGSKRNLASALVFDDDYNSLKTVVKDSVETCSDNLAVKSNQEIDRAGLELRTLLIASHVAVFLLLAIIAITIFSTVFLVVWPMAYYSKEIEQKQSLEVIGAAELRYLAESYNQMHDEVQKQTRMLKRNAERDPLTGLLNRGVFDVLLEQGIEDAALQIVDVDNFKDFNDTYGHEMGDKVLKRVADCLTHEYRTSDYVCRIGGDEFAVVMTDATPEIRHVVARKLSNAVEALREASDGVPGVTLSIGIAFSSDEVTGARWYRAADEALYQVKRRGRNGFAFYGDEGPDANGNA